jgi:hypothetical protein
MLLGEHRMIGLLLQSTRDAARRAAFTLTAATASNLRAIVWMTCGPKGSPLCVLLPLN